MAKPKSNKKPQPAQVETHLAKSFSAKVALKDLIEFIEIAQTVADEVKISASEGVLFADVVDPGHVARVHLCMQVKDLDNDSVFAIDPEKVLEMLRKVENDYEECRILFVVGTGKDGTTRVAFEFDEGRARIVMPTIDTAGMADVKALKLKYDANAEIEAAEFMRAIKAASVLHDCIELNAENGEVVARAEGDEGAGAVVFRMGSATGKGRAFYALDYIKEIVRRAGEVNPTIHLRWSTDYPMSIASENDRIRLLAIVAPRIYE